MKCPRGIPRSSTSVRRRAMKRSARCWRNYGPVGMRTRSACAGALATSIAMFTARSTPPRGSYRSAPSPSAWNRRRAGRWSTWPCGPAAAGLNFSDVLKALGLYPGLPEGRVPLGIECSGRISAVGQDVDRFRVGDEVVGIAPFSLGAYVIAPVVYVALKPNHLSFEEAATIPIAFLTAHYALNHLGRLAAGERVLIHSATGGVGLAAVQLARRVGAEVFATAGTTEKRE